MFVFARRLLANGVTEEAPSAENFELSEQDVAELKDNELLVRADYFSVDPYMRMVLTESPYSGQGPKIGDVMSGGLVGTVLASKSARINRASRLASSGPGPSTRSATPTTSARSPTASTRRAR